MFRGNHKQGWPLGASAPKKDVGKVIFLIIALFTFAIVHAKEWTADNIPMVHLQDRNRYVCDPEGLMSPADKDMADAYLRRLETQCGIQSVFVVVNNVKDGDCFRVAEDIGNKYGVGDRKTRRGLVVVIAVDDRKYFIAPGKGLEGDLTDVECDDIAQACIVKNMKEDDLDAAVLSTVKALYSKFKTGKATVDGENISSDEGDDDFPIWFGILILALSLGYPIFSLILWLLAQLGWYHPKPKNKRRRHRNDDDWFPPFFLGGGGDWGSSGGGFGGGSFGGGGAGGGW